MRKNTATIQDVSKVAGTSPSTVSRVLTGSAGVSKKKRIAVEQAIRELNYRPNHIARSLKTNTTLTLGFIVNDISNPFCGMMVRSAEEVATQLGYNIIIGNTNDDPTRELDFLALLESKQVDGIIFGPTGENSERIEQIAQRLPLIQVDRRIEAVEVAAVVVDNEGGAYNATQHLIHAGHKHIGLLAYERQISTIRDRIMGCERAVAMHPAGDIRATIKHISGSSAMDYIIRAALEFLSQPDRPLAFFALNNRIGVAILQATRQLGLSIPDDLALVVFDDLDIFTINQPMISVVDQPTALIGKRAVELIISQINDAKDRVAEVITLPTTLIHRESV
jgi:DNA-binding LacI/PurR family transcriptional regulator